MYISHSPTTLSSTFYCFATGARVCIFLHLLPTTGIPLSSHWQVQTPCVEWQCQRFRVVHWAVQISFHSYLFSSPPVCLSCSSSFALFRSASLSLLSVLSFFAVLYPPNFYMDSMSSWFPPLPVHTFSTTLVVRRGEAGRVLIVMHGRSRMTIAPRILTMPGRSPSGFHRPGRHR